MRVLSKPVTLTTHSSEIRRISPYPTKLLRVSQLRLINLAAIGKALPSITTLNSSGDRTGFSRTILSHWLWRSKTYKERVWQAIITQSPTFNQINIVKESSTCQLKKYSLGGWPKINVPWILNPQQLQYLAQLRKKIITKFKQHVGQNTTSLRRRWREAQAPTEMKLNLVKIVDRYPLLAAAELKQSLRCRDLATTLLTISWLSPLA